MKTLHLLLTLAVGAAMSCNQTSSQTNKNTDTLKTAATNTPVNACYLQVTGKDSVLLRVNYQDSTVSGQLTYNYYEKDKNTGNITGTIHDGIIRANYQFMSEGTQSTRPVVFKITGDQAFEALSDSFSQEGLPVFAADNASLKFNNTPLEKTNCD